MVDRFLEYIFIYMVFNHVSGFIRFICSGSICSDRTSGLDYSESNHIVTHTTQYTFSYIYRSLYRVIHIM